MSDRIDHGERWDDELAAYALDALDPPETELVESHLADCGRCRERVHWLLPAVDMLPAAVAQQEPPSAMRERLLAITRKEAAPAEPSAGALAGTRDDAPRRRAWLSGLEGFSMRAALAGLAVALLLAAGVAGYSLRDDGSAQVRTYAAVPPGKGSPAEGALEVSGDAGTLEVRNLPGTGKHEVYQAWVRRTGDGGGIEPSSVFVLAKDGSGVVAIPSGLEGADEVMVTREPVGGSESPHESPLLIAKLD